MRISFSPQRRDDALTVTKKGDVLTINGEDFDFSVVPEGATLPFGAVKCPFIAGEISRINGELHVPLLLPHGPIPLKAVAFPEDIEDVPDGPVAVPFDPEPEPIEDPTDE